MEDEGEDRSARIKSQVVNVGRCATCGKVSYLSRKDARAIARQMTPDDRPRAYRCSANPDHWHVGHVPAVVRQGIVSRDEWRETLENNS